jgi:hypothetical protein
MAELLTIEQPPKGSMSKKVEHSLNRAICYRLTVLYSYVNAKGSTSALASYCITMCKQGGVSSENRVVMQAHQGINFHLVF